MVDYAEEFKVFQEKFNRLKAQRDSKIELLRQCGITMESANKTYADSEKARIVVQNVANQVQKDLEYRITNIVTMALAAVFPDPYNFKVEFVVRRNQTECDMLFTKDGNECDPIDASGGGAIDIASLALRMAIWSINKTRAIQILDEPCKFLSRDMQSKASEILKELSDKLGIQLVIVSHIPEMIESADRVIQVEQKDGISKVRIL